MTYSLDGFHRDVARFVRDWIHRQLFTQPSAILEGAPDCRLDARMPMRLFRIHELVVASLCEALGQIGSAGGELQVCAAVPRTWNRPEICRYIFPHVWLLFRSRAFERNRSNLEFK